MKMYKNNTLKIDRNLKQIVGLLFAVFCMFLYCACSKQKDSNDIAEHFIKVDSPDKIKFSDLFDEYRLIFPETTNSSLFGSLITKIERYKDRLYLLNEMQSGRNILCFDTCGKFLFPIDKLGQGPGEYTFLSYFFIDTYLNSIIIVSEGNLWLYFDLDGNYLYSKKLPFTDVTRYTCEFNDSLYITYRIANTEISEVVFLDKSTLEVKHPVEPTTPFLKNFTPDLSISRTKDVFYYYSGNDTIYDISSDIGNKTAVYYVDFGKKEKECKINYSLTNERLTQSVVQAFINGEVRPVIGFFHDGKHIAINYAEFDKEDHQKQYGGGIGHNFPTVFYDISTRKSYNTKQIDFDIFNSVPIKKMSVLGCFDGYFYAVINDFFEDDELKKIAKNKYFPEDTKKSLRDFNDESNRIIIVFK
jgi:hypothetical protein